MTEAAKDMLTILVCPLSKAPLIYDKKNQELISKRAGLAYPVRDGVPVMLKDEARALTPEEVAKLNND
ncbi:MAG: Trm112 family protein [Sphingomonadales bacterium]|nr:Trm112 family protein [Sphingomonadales bacterium]